MSLISLQGAIRVHDRLVSGKPGKGYFVGNVPEATINLATESESVKESFSGSRLPYGTLETGRSGTLTMSFDEWLVKNMALAMHAVSLATTPVAVVGEVFPTGLVAGDQIRLAHPYVDTDGVVLKDSAVGPATVATTKYKLIGHNRSIVELLDVAGFTQPFKADYEYEAYTSLEAFSQASPEKYVIFDGIDTVANVGVFVELYRVKFAPVSNLGLIHAGKGSLPMSAEVLYDPLNLDSNGKGGFYRYTQKAA